MLFIALDYCLTKFLDLFSILLSNQLLLLQGLTRKN
jgi:hypothetical protein